MLAAPGNATHSENLVGTGSAVVTSFRLGVGDEREHVVIVVQFLTPAAGS